MKTGGFLGLGLFLLAVKNSTFITRRPDRSRTPGDDKALALVSILVAAKVLEVARVGEVLPDVLARITDAVFCRVGEGSSPDDFTA